MAGQASQAKERLKLWECSRRAFWRNGLINRIGGMGMSNLSCAECNYHGFFVGGRCPMCGSTNLASDEAFLDKPDFDEEVYLSNEEIAKEPVRD